MWKKPLNIVRVTKSHPTTKIDQWFTIQWLRLSINFSFQLGLCIRIRFKIGWDHGLGQKPVIPGSSVTDVVFWVYLMAHNSDLGDFYGVRKIRKIIYIYIYITKIGFGKFRL